ncbi:MAG: hypothetical protein B6I26_03005 [Desulfobacteraceae bacterium 4572_130]|nr:MAG: hypothetical protein B6I26_03005 [Desulfobacteraceae bacterium 4572_130]
MPIITTNINILSQYKNQINLVNNTSSLTKKSSIAKDLSYNIQLTNKAEKLEHEYNNKKRVLKQKYDNEKQKLEQEYNIDKKKLESNYKNKKKITKLNFYA